MLVHLYNFETIDWGRGGINIPFSGKRERGWGDIIVIIM